MNESKTIFSLISGKVFRSYRKWSHVEPKSKVWEVFKFFFISSSHWIIILNVFWVLFSFLCEEKNVKFPMSRQLPCLPNHGFILFWYLCLQVSMPTFMWLCLGILSLQLKFNIFIFHYDFFNLSLCFTWHKQLKLFMPVLSFIWFN